MDSLADIPDKQTQIRMVLFLLKMNCYFVIDYSSNGMKYLVQKCALHIKI